MQESRLVENGKYLKICFAEPKALGLSRPTSMRNETNHPFRLHPVGHQGRQVEESGKGEGGAEEWEEGRETEIRKDTMRTLLELALITLGIVFIATSLVVAVHFIVKYW
jgi:hypothetical protein